jgi:hypothetical protein
MPPVFIPLKKQWFLAFQSGAKTIEYRAYGPRWNERVCTPGRAATISCGYSGARISARIKRFRILPARSAPAAVRAFFPGVARIAAIHLSLSAR